MKINESTLPTVLHVGGREVVETRTRQSQKAFFMLSIGFRLFFCTLFLSNSLSKYQFIYQCVYVLKLSNLVLLPYLPLSNSLSSAPKKQEKCVETKSSRYQ